MIRLCTICARGGSKGVPGKNLRPLSGLPLIAHSINQAAKSGLFEFVAVSSDSRDILAVASIHGASTIHRPDSLATDEAPKLPAIGHALREMETRHNVRFDTLIDLDCTSPLRDIEDIKGAAMVLESRKVGNVITGSPARRHPKFNLVRRPRGSVHVQLYDPSKIYRRQDAPECWDMNASIYAWDRSRIKEHPVLWNHDTQLYEMPIERSWDIDTELDFKIVEMLMEMRDGAS